MLMPKKVKYRKKQRGRRRGRAKGGDYIAFGDHALQAVEAGWVSSRQIESARIAFASGVKRGGKIWMRVFPDKPITKKPLETRMCKGMVNPEWWVAVVKPGRILFEVEGVDAEVTKRAIELASYKFGIKTRYISRENTAW